jgi:hypothetical protein
VLSDDQLRRSAFSALNDRERGRCAVYVRLLPTLPGESIAAPRTSFECASRGALLFVDLEPEANWSHPCCYLCVDETDASVTRIDARFPPATTEELLRSWRAIHEQRSAT